MFRPYLELPRQVHVLCLGTFVNRAGTFLLPFLALYLDKQLGLGPQTATRAVSFYGWGAICAALVGGHLADVLGRRTVMLGSLLGGAVLLVFLGSIRNPWLIALAVLAFSLVAEMYRPAASAMIGDLTLPHQRGPAFGLMYVSINLGMTVAPVVGGILAGYSFQWLFWGDAITSAAYAVIILLAIRETLGAPGRGAGVDRSDASLAEAVRHLRQDRVFQWFCVATLLAAVVFMQSFVSFPLHLNRGGWGPRSYGLLIALNAIMVSTFQLPLTPLLARFNRAHVLVVGTFLIGAGFALTGPAESMPQFALAVVVWTVGEMLQAPFMPAIVSDLAPARFRGRYMGMVGVCYSLAMALGAPAGGEVLARYGPACLWTGCLVLGTASAAIFFAIRARIGSVKPAAIAGEPVDCRPATAGPEP